MLNKLKTFLFKLIDLLKIERKQLSVFFFLLGLSLIFWVLTVLSKDYTSTIRYQAEFVDFPAQKLLVEKKDVELQLQVNAPGFTLLAHKFRLNKSIPLSVSGFIPKKNGAVWNYFWLGEKSLSEVQEGLPNSMQLLHIQPSRIDLMLDEKAQRTVKVNLQSNFDFEPMFRMKGFVKLDPPSVVISGPQAVVDVFNSINTKSVDFQNINSNLTGTIELEELDHADLTFSEKVINWELDVEQFTEGSVDLSMVKKNIPKGYDLKLFPNQISVQFLVSLDNFDLVNSANFVAEVEFDKDKKRLNVGLVNKPDFIENVRIVPSKVEYILIKN